MTTYPLAREGVFGTLQGEGILLGTPMTFVRFAGCDVNCSGCDTDYAHHERVTPDELVRRIAAVAECDWVWVTGGEPTLHDLAPLTHGLHRLGFRLALATAGRRPVPRGDAPAVGYNGFDFVSVSPHAIDATWVQRCGEQLNVVPGLNGLSLADLEGVDVSGFAHRFVTPLYGTDAAECAAWVRAHPGWRLGVQAHRVWGVA